MTVGYEDDDERLIMRAKAFADEQLKQLLDGKVTGELVKHLSVREIVHKASENAFFVGYRTGAVDATEPRVKTGLVDPMRPRRRR